MSVNVAVGADAILIEAVTHPESVLDDIESVERVYVSLR